MANAMPPIQLPSQPKYTATAPQPVLTSPHAAVDKK